MACPSGRMGRKDFFKFYRSLRVESEEKVKEIANFVFTAFDRDSNGKIDFTEFLCKSTLPSLIPLQSQSFQVVMPSHPWEQCDKN